MIISYGNVFAYNYFEMIYGICIMMMGGLMMAQGISTLSQILVSMDESNAKFEEGMEVLNKIRDSYYLPLDTYLRLKKSIRHKFDKDVKDLNDFLDDLPQNLKIEAAKYIHEGTKMQIEVF